MEDVLWVVSSSQKTLQNLLPLLAALPCAGLEELRETLDTTAQWSPKAT
jgi:hypothetical protein